MGMFSLKKKVRLSAIEKEINVDSEFKKQNSNLKNFQRFLGVSDYVFNKVIEKYNLTEKEQLDTRTEEQIRNDIQDKFITLEEIIKGVVNSQISGIIISGPGGMGKTYTVEKVLRNSDKDYRHVSGFVSPLGLYEVLYENCEEDRILIFDDCDSVFQTPQTLNLLKAALDTKPERTISWESTELRGGELPRSFKFRGRIIFLTNKILKGEHFEALMTRIHHLNLHMTPLELIHRMETVLSQIEHRNASETEKREVLTFMKKNIDILKNGKLNLRTFIKILEIRLMSKLNWEKMVTTMYLKNAN